MKPGEVVLLNADDPERIEDYIFVELTFEKIKCIFKEVAGPCIVECNPQNNPVFISRNRFFKKKRNT